MEMLECFAVDVLYVLSTLSNLPKLQTQPYQSTQQATPQHNLSPLQSSHGRPTETFFPLAGLDGADWGTMGAAGWRGGGAGEGDIKHTLACLESGAAARCEKTTDAANIRKHEDVNSRLL